MTSWNDIIARIKTQRESFTIGRLARACKALGLGPSFSVDERDRVKAVLNTKGENGREIINYGLRNLSALVAREGLSVTVCSRYLSDSEKARAAEHQRFGQPFNNDIKDYIAAESRPTDKHGRKRHTREGLERRDRDAILRAASICEAAGCKPTRLKDLLLASSRRAIIDFYGADEVASGGCLVCFKTLKHVADVLQDVEALSDITRQIGKMEKPSDALSVQARKILTPYHDVRHRDATLAKLAQVLAQIERGWPGVFVLYRIQAALACLMMYFLSAAPIVVHAIAFDLTGGERVTPWGSRPLLRSTSVPNEIIEARLPEAIRVALDLYWAQMPVSLRAVGEVFVTHDGKKKELGSFRVRNQRLLAELEIKLTCIGLIDLAVLDMRWDTNMTPPQMAIALRFASTDAFTKRYKVLIDAIDLMKRRSRSRPGRIGSVPPSRGRNSGPL